MRDVTRLPVAVVLGAKVWTGGAPSPALRRRAERAARLWHDGQVAAVLACGGRGSHGPTEAEAICAVLRAAGVPEAALYREARSTTTEDNLRFATPILRDIGAPSIIVVSDAYHLPRALLVARRQGWPARGASPPLSGASLRVFLRGVLREIPAFARYWWLRKGR